MDKRLSPREAARRFPEITEPPEDYSLEERSEFLDERRKMQEARSPGQRD